MAVEVATSNMLPVWAILLYSYKEGSLELQPNLPRTPESGKDGLTYHSSA